MSVVTILKEFWRFFKDYFVKILLGAVLVGVLTMGLKWAFDAYTESLYQDAAAEDQNPELLAEQMDYLAEIYQEEPAEFTFVVQLEDGAIFENSFIFDEYFSSEEVVKEISQATGVNYAPTIEAEKSLGLIKTSSYRGSIAAIRDRSSSVITMRVLAAPTAEENLILADEMYRLMNESELPFMENLTYIPMSTPEIGESLVEEEMTMVASPASLGLINTSEIGQGQTNWLLYFILGFILGIFIATVILFIVQLFKKKITYAFQYAWDFEDVHLLLDQDQDPRPYIEQPADRTRLVTWEGEAERGNSDYQELVILIDSGQTSKAWFNEQYQLAEVNEAQVKIIHRI